MKVLFYIHSLVVGGAETLVTNYAIELKKMGHEIIIVEDNITKSFLQDRIKNEKIKTYTLFNKSPKSIFDRVGRYLSKALLKKKWNEIIRIEQPDIIHLHTAPFNYRICFPINRTVFSFHADVQRTIKLLGEKNREKIETLSKNNMAFIAISKQIESDIRRLFNTDNVFYIPNGLDIELLSMCKYNKADLCKELNISENAFLVGHVGRFDKVKNHEKIIGVFKEIHNIKNNSLLLLVGSGTNEQIAHVKSLVMTHGLDKNVVFLGVRNDAIQIESCFDVLLLPSHSESFSLTLVESQIHGIRCIASTNVPNDVICNNNCFQLPLSSSDKEWAQLAVDNCLRSESKGIEQFDIHNVTTQMVGLYESLLRIRR